MGGGCETLGVSIRVGKRGEDEEERICAAAAAPSVGDFSPFSGGDETGATRLIQNFRSASPVLAVCVRGQAFHWTCGSRAYLYFFTPLSTADLSGCGLVAAIGILVNRHTKSTYLSIL